MILPPYSCFLFIADILPNGIKFGNFAEAVGINQSQVRWEIGLSEAEYLTIKDHNFLSEVGL